MPHSYSMMQAAYPYRLIRPKRYIFISNGKRKIEKIVDFVPLGVGNLINIGFGDLSPDGSFDDKINSNNGDIVKVMATVIEILKHFTNEYPEAEIYFEGSTRERTKLYHRILKTYYVIFSKDFEIAGIQETDHDFEARPFDPSLNKKYIAFVIKRIS
jgi:hypothetical protein